MRTQTILTFIGFHLAMQANKTSSLLRAKRGLLIASMILFSHHAIAQIESVPPMSIIFTPLVPANSPFYRQISVSSIDAATCKQAAYAYYAMVGGSPRGDEVYTIGGFTCYENSVNAFYIYPTCPTATPSYGFNNQTNRCERQAQNLTITLFGLVNVEPDQSTGIQARVVDSNNQPFAGAIVHLKVEALPNSGGHIHGDNNDTKRRGKLNGIGSEIVATSPTGAAGIFNFTFNGPEVSGTYKITAWCDNRTCTQQGANTMDVKIDGLVPLPPSINFHREIGDKPWHPDNHYLTPAAIEKANLLAYYYKNPFSPAPLLRYNDASLKWGGVFDIEQDWRPSHHEHRRGTVIDVRANRTATAIPVGNYEMFKKLVRINIKGEYLHEGTGTPNEHFHVRLLKRAE